MQNHSISNVFLFNPTCEYAVANGNTTWHPNKILQKMEADLATLPLFFAKSSDKIIVDTIPGKEYTDHLQKTGIDLPDFILKQAVKAGPINFPVQQLNPWGWSPAAHHFLNPLKQNCSSDFKNSPVFNWHPSYKNLYSKKFASEILKQLAHQFPSEYFIKEEQLTEVCTTQEDHEILLKKWDKIMVKAPWSSSGRGLQPITKTPVHPKVWDKVRGLIKEQGYTIVEPYLDKVIDLAFQFEIKHGKINYLGISNFLTDEKGQYKGNHLKGLPDNLDTAVKEFVEYLPSIIINPLIEILESSDLAKNYEGFFGVDTLIFKDEQSQLKVNPCLEINLRHNMGLLSLYLEKLIVHHKKGLFSTYFKPGTSFYQFKKEMEAKHPLVIHNNKIESGFWSLTEAKKDTAFGAYILV
jgi:hypothetical protein